MRDLHISRDGVEVVADLVESLALILRHPLSKLCHECLSDRQGCLARLQEILEFLGLQIEEFPNAWALLRRVDELPVGRSDAAKLALTPLM